MMRITSTKEEEQQHQQKDRPLGLPPPPHDILSIPQQATKKEGQSIQRKRKSAVHTTTIPITPLYNASPIGSVVFRLQGKQQDPLERTACLWKMEQYCLARDVPMFFAPTHRGSTEYLGYIRIHADPQSWKRVRKQAERLHLFCHLEPWDIPEDVRYQEYAYYAKKQREENEKGGDTVCIP